MASTCVRFQYLIASVIWLELCAPALSFSTSNTYTNLLQGNKRTEDHHTLFALSPKNKKLAMSRTDHTVDGSLHASALFKEEQISPSNGEEATMNENTWISSNKTIAMQNDVIVSNIESDLLNQVLAYENLLKRTQEQSYIEGTRDTLLESHTRTTWDEEEILNSVIRPVQIYEGKTVADITQEQIDHSGNTVMGLSEVWQARIFLIISAALYGTNFTFVKMLNDYVPTDIGAVLRFALAAGVTLPWLFGSSNKDKTVNDRSEYRKSTFNGISHHLPKDNLIQITNFMDTPIFAGLEVGVWTAIGYLAQAEGLETIEAGKSAFICSLAVVIVPLLDFLAGKKILHRQAMGAILALVGVGFLEVEGPISAITEGGGAFGLDNGDLLSIVQPFAFGLGFWRMEAAMRRFPDDAMKTTAAQLLSVFVISAAYWWTHTGRIDGLPEYSQMISWITDPLILGSLLWTGVVTTAFTVYLETLALKTLSAAETTMLFSTEPLFGATFAAAVMGETFGTGGYIGAILILAGCIFSNLDFDSFKNVKIR